MIGGVPVGEDDFVFEVMRRKADEIVSYVDHTMSTLRDRPHSAWASLYYSSVPRALTTGCVTSRHTSCEREVCLGCVRELLVCVWLCA